MSYAQLIDDVEDAEAAVLEKAVDVSGGVNGEHEHQAGSEKVLRHQLFMFKQNLESFIRKNVVNEPDVRAEDHQKTAPEMARSPTVDEQTRGLVLTLSSVTGKGPRQLYSGLQRPKVVEDDAFSFENAGLEEFALLDVNALPNGIAVIDPGSLHAHGKKKEAREARTLAEVFGPFRTAKTLEAPRPPRSSANMKDGVLTFADATEVSFVNATRTHKMDYKFTLLPTGQWLQYHTASAAQLELEAKKRLRDRAMNFAEGSLATPQEEAVEYNEAKTEALFQAAYSSFAPTVDNSMAVVSERTRSALWWRKSGSKRYKALFSNHCPEEGLAEPTSDSIEDTAETEFEQLINDFEPEENPLSAPEAPSGTVDHNQKETDALLEEISQLLETLSSYHRMRNLGSTSRTSTTETSKSQVPSGGEIDTYEMLESQLAILVASLPPFAVAKLNGNQLAELNISAKLVVENYDYPGTMELDELTLQKRRAIQAAQVAAGRTTAVPQTRPLGYPTTAAPPSTYNQRAYGSNAARATTYQPPARPYSQTGTPQYQTPQARPQSASAQRPGYPSQPPQQAATPSYPNASQFQRPMQNGYGNYAATTPQASTYAQRPTQPYYQQRAQDTDRRSPPMPLTNGQTPYGGYSNPQRSAVPMGYGTGAPRTTTPSTAEQMALERAKVAAMAQQQRQAAGTPQTPGYGYGGDQQRRDMPNGATVSAGSGQ